jgi:hypothetical protein
MFGQSGPILRTATTNSAAQASIKNFIHSGAKEPDTASVQCSAKTKIGQYLGLGRIVKCRPGAYPAVRKPGPGKRSQLDAVITSLSLQDGNSKIGNLYAIRDSIYYPVVAPVTEKAR